MSLTGKPSHGMFSMGEKMCISISMWSYKLKPSIYMHLIIRYLLSFHRLSLSRRIYAVVSGYGIHGWFTAQWYSGTKVCIGVVFTLAPGIPSHFSQVYIYLCSSDGTCVHPELWTRVAINGVKLQEAQAPHSIFLKTNCLRSSINLWKY